MIAPITYPARPMTGGRKPPPELPGDWDYEPKGNGFRLTVNTRHRLLWNRHNEPLSIADEFDEALEKASRLPFEWLDCEGLERRHGFGKGTLVVIDAPLLGGTYRQRRDILEKFIPPLIGSPELWPENSVRLFPRFERKQVDEAWTTLRKINELCGAAPLNRPWEGLVGKRADSLYPIQLRNPEETFSGWIKYKYA